MTKRKAKQVSAEKGTGGRPSKYSDTLLATICERLSQGEPMAAICRDKGMPTDRTIRNWITDNDAVSSAIAHAREAGFDAIALEALEIADDSRNDYIDKLADDGDGKAEEARSNGEVIQRSKLRVETRLKLLAKWDPKRYGEKVTLAGDPDNPLALIERVNKAGERAAQG